MNAPMEPDLMAKARELLALEYERGGRDGPYPTYADLARRGEGAFTQCAIRAVASALAAQSARLAAVEAALKLAICWFEEYAAMHRAKGTDEGHNKAQRNQERADELRSALRAPATEATGYEHT